MLPWSCTHVDLRHGYDQNRNINTIIGVNITSVYKPSLSHAIGQDKNMTSEFRDMPTWKN